MEGDSKGRATQLADNNINVPTLLAMGEWSTPAMLRYIDEDAQSCIDNVVLGPLDHGNCFASAKQLHLIDFC